MASIPISKTKIIPPRRRDELLTRKRLVDFLFDSLDKKLILVSAPAGYGKTSLLIDFANQSDIACCWLALDEMDRDPQRFLAYLIAAIAERFPDFGAASVSMLGGLTSFEQDMEKMLVMLVNEAYEQIHEHFILVLDDFHLIENIQPIQSFLNRFLQLVDENCHVVISSRVLNSLPDLPLMVARDQVSGLGFADLAFHPDEIQSLLAQNNNLHISDDEARKMIETTEGWIAGLQFSGMGFLPPSHTGVGLSDFLGQQVLDRQPEYLRDFILRTSMLGEFDSSLCETVLAPLYAEPQNWHRLIASVVQNNLFVLPVGDDGRWLRYHHLFRDFLRKRFEQTHPEEVRPILQRLGQAHENLAEWEKAYYTYKQLNDTGLQAALIEHAAATMLLNARVTLESWLNDLPPSMLRTRPGLLSIRGTILDTKGQAREGLDLLNQAEQAFRAEQNVPGLARALLRRGSVHRFLGDFDATLRDAEESMQLTETVDDLQVMYAEGLRLKALALYRLGHARQSVSFFESSLNLYIRLKHTPTIPILFMETGMAYQTIGSYAEAGTAYDKALQIWQRDGNLLWQASLLNNLAILHQSYGEYEKAALAFENGLLCARRSSYTRMEALISIGLGDMYSELEDFSIALTNYENAEEIARRINDRFLIFYTITARVRLALLQKDADGAHRIMEQDVELFQSNASSRYERGLLALMRGHLALLTHENAEAVAHLEEALRCFSEDGRKLEGDTSRIWLAAASHQNRNNELAAQVLKPLLGTQPAHPVLVAVHQAQMWLNGLQTHPEVGRMVGDLFIRAARFSARIPADRRQLRRMAHVLQIPNPHMVIQAFGRAAVSVGGKTLSLSDWQTQSVRDLFFYFLTASRAFTKEQIAETLWPEVDEPHKIRLRFKNEIYRLRRAVGQEIIAYEDIFYKFNRSLDFEYDVEAFEAFLAHAKAAATPVEQIGYYKKAVDLVQGPFLEDVYADWATPERERLSQVYLSTLLTLGDLLLKQTQTEQALVICKRALDYDVTFEAAYALSMQVYHRMGDRAAIVRTFQTCEEVMQRELGLPPSRETKELYKRLVM